MPWLQDGHTPLAGASGPLIRLTIVEFLISKQSNFIFLNLQEPLSNQYTDTLSTYPISSAHSLIDSLDHLITDPLTDSPTHLITDPLTGGQREREIRDSLRDLIRDSETHLITDSLTDSLTQSHTHTHTLVLLT